MNKQKLSGVRRATKGLMTGLLILLLIFILFVVMLNGGITSSIDYLQVVTGFKEEKSEMVTYYQWTSPSGEMKVSRDAPTHTNFITFEAPANLQQTEYNIDPEMIKQGQQIRDSLVNDESNRATDNSARASGLPSGNPIRKVKGKLACIDMQRTIDEASWELENGDLKAKEFDRLQKKLRELKWNKAKLDC